jgi:hypothetical protein
VTATAVTSPPRLVDEEAWVLVVDGVDDDWWDTRRHFGRGRRRREWVAGEVGAGVDVGLAVDVGLLAGCRPEANATAPTIATRTTAATPAATTRPALARVDGICKSFRTF